MKISDESRMALVAMLSALGVSPDRQQRAFAVMEGDDAPEFSDVGRVLRPREVSARLGVTDRTVRVWGIKGLLKPVTGAGARTVGYTAESVRALIEGRANCGRVAK